MKISERCSCGASVEIEVNSTSVAEKYIEEWRGKHHHTVRNPYTSYGGYSIHNTEMVDVPLYSSGSGSK